MYYYLYQITNKINNHFYIGIHQTNNLNDGYFGSGTALKKAIKKYGKENFEKVILEYFDNEEEMFNREKEIVTKELIKRSDVYNISLGGNGFTSEAASLLSKRNWENPEMREKMISFSKSEEFKELQRNNANVRYSNVEYKEKWLKTVQSPEYREKISKITKEKLANPEVREKLKGERRTQEYLDYLSEIYKEKWEDEDYRNKMCEMSKKLWENPEYREKISLSRKNMWNNIEYRKNIIQKRKEMWKDPEYIKKIKDQRNGRKWIYSEKENRNKCVRPEEIDEYIKNGWKLGKIRVNK